MRAAIERRGLTALAIVAACVLALPANSWAQTTDPIVGTWKMDVAKSTFKPGPGGKSSTVVIDAAGKALKVSIDAATPEGPVKWSYTAAPDGKDVPITGNPAADTASVTQPNPNEWAVVYKMGGKPVMKSKVVVAKDGKTMTVTQDGTDPKGQAIHNVLHFVKQ